jgi:hypothetical protein
MQKANNMIIIGILIGIGVGTPLGFFINKLRSKLKTHQLSTALGGFVKSNPKTIRKVEL